MNKAPKDDKIKVSMGHAMLKLMGLSFKMVPLDMAVNIPLGVAHSVSFGIITLASKYLFESVTGLTAGGLVSAAFWAAALLGLANVVSQVLNGVSNFLINVIFEKMKGKLSRLLHEKASRISPVNYESPEFLDSLEKARRGTDVGIFASFGVLMLFTFYLPYFVFMGFFLNSLSPVLTLSLVLVFAPIIIAQLIRFKIFAKMEDDVAPARRAMEYREKTICDRQFFKETRLLGAFRHMQGMYRDAISFLNKKSWDAEKRALLREMISRVLTIAGYMGILYMMVTLLLAGEITPGGFAAVFSSLSMLFSIAEEVVGRHLGQIVENSASVRNLVQFLEMPEEAGADGDFDASMGIHLSDVRFTYPGAETETLRGVTLDIAPGEVVAIVGENGAGKSTLVKMMMGLYRPSSGTAIIGGLNASEVHPGSVYRGLSSVFQKYQRYRMTLGDNVSVSDDDQPGDDLDERVNDACRSADLSTEGDSFPNGQDTMLSREFDGVDISGGQWQRVAIARGLFRSHEMVVLDEPTAAIDPLEETRVYRQFARISKGKTAVIVTHRLGSTRIADRIVVMSGGLIDDIGTHDELMRRGGLYSRMYNAQAQWYNTPGENIVFAREG